MKSLPQAFKNANPLFNSQNKEIFVQPVYDRVNLATSLTGQILAFSVPKGTTVSLIRGGAVTSAVKTVRDTNLPQPGADNNRDYLLYGLSMALFPTSHAPTGANSASIRADKDQIKEGGVLNFKIGDKQIIDLPLWQIPEMNAESGASSTATGSTVFGGAQFNSPYVNFGEEIPLIRGQVISMAITFDGTITLSQSFDLALVFAAALKRDS
jgi:hypothetical protein